MVDAGSSDDMMRLYEENDILGGSGDVDSDKLRAKGRGVMRIDVYKRQVSAYLGKSVRDTDSLWSLSPEELARFQELPDIWEKMCIRDRRVNPTNESPWNKRMTEIKDKLKH